MSQPQAEDHLSAETVTTLIQLRETDQSIGSLERDLARQPAKMDASKRKIAKAETAAGEAGEIVVVAQKRIDSKSVESDSIQADIKKLENQLFTLKSTNEFDAMKGQIKAKEELDDKLQTEVLELMEGMSDLKEAKAREAKALEDAGAAYKRVEAEVAAETAEIEKRLDEARARRAELEQQLPDNVRELHARVCERRGTGVAQILDEICKGCDTRVMAQVMNRVMGSRLVQCPHCDRILYITG